MNHPIYSLEWIREYSSCKKAEFLNPTTIEVYYRFDTETPEKIIPESIISFEGLCLVEAMGEEDNWLMGDIHDDGNLYCWAYYGTLPNAINSL